MTAPGNELAKNLTEEKLTLPTGSTRSVIQERYDLISPIALRRLAARYAVGAATHGERNWEKGQPANVVMNHLLRHAFCWLAGDRTDDHLAAVCWGACALMHFEETMPAMIDTPVEGSC